MRVLIAGGTGFIGRGLSAGALAQGWEVFLLTRHPMSKPAAALRGMGAKLIPGDLTRADTLQTAFETARPDIYLHNAGWYELGIAHTARAAMRLVNVKGLQNALDTAQTWGTPRIVVTSSTTALGDTQGHLADETFQRQTSPGSWYEQTLIEANEVIMTARARGQAIIVGRPAQVIGPGDHSPYGRLFRMYLRRLLPPLVWGPEGAFSFVHVDDTAQALLRLAESGEVGSDYFIAGGVMSNRAMLDTWVSALGRRTHFIWLPRPLAMVTGSLLAPFLRLARQPAFISPEVVRSSFVSFRYSSGKIQRELGVQFRDARQAWLDTIDAEVQRRG